MKNQSRKTDKLGRKQYSGSERRELVRKFEKSEGVTQADFSKANGLEHTTFSGWLRRLGRKKRKSFPVEFAEVELPPAACHQRRSP